MYVFNSRNSLWFPVTAILLTALVMFTGPGAPLAGYAGPLAGIRPASLLWVIVGLGLLAWGLVLAAREHGLPLATVLRRTANIVTLSRLVLGLTGIFILANSWDRPGALGLAALVLLLIALALDGVDGNVARWGLARQRLAGKPSIASCERHTDIGGWLDMESDSLIFLFGGWSLVSLGLVPAWFLLTGLYRYLFGLLFRFPAWNLQSPPWFRWTAKTIAAISQVCLGGLWLAGLALPGEGRLGVVAVLTLVPLVLLTASFLIEGSLRLRGLMRAGGARVWAGLLKSLLVYYAVPLRRSRLRRFYAAFLAPGGLGMDVGAHLGNRVRAWHDLGARVVAVEPQRPCLVLLNNWFGGLEKVVIEGCGLGASQGNLVLQVSERNPSLSSVAGGWVSRMRENQLFSAVRWNASYQVPVTTLEDLILRYGEPDFIKVDVEGYEQEVLSGLQRPVKALSFEFLPPSIEVALACVGLVAGLGSYEFNASMVETLRFVFPRWQDEQGIRGFLEEVSTGTRSGDIYARRVAP